MKMMMDMIEQWYDVNVFDSFLFFSSCFVTGKIELEYQKKGQEPPMGLRTCETAQLRKTLDRLRNQ